MTEITNRQTCDACPFPPADPDAIHGHEYRVPAKLSKAPIYLSRALFEGIEVPAGWPTFEAEIAGWPTW